jgi:hypothetical protein
VAQASSFTVRPAVAACDVIALLPRSRSYTADARVRMRIGEQGLEDVESNVDDRSLQWRTDLDEAEACQTLDVLRFGKYI